MSQRCRNALYHQRMFLAFRLCGLGPSGLNQVSQAVSLLEAPREEPCPSPSQFVEAALSSTFIPLPSGSPLACF